MKEDEERKKDPYIIRLKDNFGVIPPGDFDRKDFMVFVQGHLAFLRSLQNDGFESIAMSHSLLADHSLPKLASQILHFDRWSACALSLYYIIKIQQLIDWLDDPENKKWPREGTK